MLSLVMTMSFLVPLTAHAQELGKTVRVGWYESPFNTMDQFGRRSGYAYDYQRKIAAYTGWNYEYVEGSWPELLQMLIDGEIDLMSDVSFTDERAESICRIFKHSPVFRIGGDEFAVILENEDYQNRKELTELFDKKANEIRASAENKWEQVSVALGMAEYDPQSDTSVDDVIHRADKTMYENKRTRKEGNIVR